MNGGLRSFLDLPEFEPREMSPQGEALGQSFRDKLQGVNQKLQQLAAQGGPGEHHSLEGQRGVLIEAFQKTSSLIDPADPAKAGQPIERLMSALDKVEANAASVLQSAQHAHDQWLANEEAFDGAVERIGELEDSGHPKAGLLRELAETIRGKANGRDFQSSLGALDQMLPKLEGIYQEFRQAAGGAADNGAASLPVQSATPPPTTQPPPPVNPYAGQKLQNGSSGDAVKQLQQMLNAQGAGLAVDGLFGPATARALANFQKQSGLPASGVTDDATWSALGGGSTSPPPTTGGPTMPTQADPTGGAAEAGGAAGQTVGGDVPPSGMLPTNPTSTGSEVGSVKFFLSKDSLSLPSATFVAVVGGKQATGSLLDLDEITVDNVPVGVQSYSVFAPGFHPSAGEVVVSAGKVAIVRVILTPSDEAPTPKDNLDPSQSGVLLQVLLYDAAGVIRPQRGFSVSYAGKPIPGSCPMFALNFPPLGNGVLQVVGPGYQPFAQNLWVDKDYNEVVNVTLVPLSTDPRDDKKEREKEEQQRRLEVARGEAQHAMGKCNYCNAQGIPIKPAAAQEYSRGFDAYSRAQNYEAEQPDKAIQFYNEATAAFREGDRLQDGGAPTQQKAGLTLTVQGGLDMTKVSLMGVGGESTPPARYDGLESGVYTAVATTQSMGRGTKVQVQSTQVNLNPGDDKTVTLTFTGKEPMVYPDQVEEEAKRGGGEPETQPGGSSTDTSAEAQQAVEEAQQAIDEALRGIDF